MKAFLLSLICIVFSDGIIAQCNRGPLPPPESEETVLYADNIGEVQLAIENANGKTTIYLNSGLYPVSPSSFINVYKPDITIRSTSGNRNDVIIQGEGMAAGGGVGHGIFVDADNITVADLTVRDVQNHAFFVNPGADSCLFHNVRGLDTRGIIGNNFILGYAYSDFGIGLAFAPDAKVINNTIYSPGGWPYSIEARFSETTNCAIMNNFSDEGIWDNRDGASSNLTTNNTTATPSDFVNVVEGDLHLKSNAVSVINAGTDTPDRCEK
jgi:hypothetical protein